ncbi:MAG: hypothetical protein C5B50_17505 [Verrucomicrobia bacterium]|nr:MAG: hypothetical protein C5B50_17505 [Verrucomicrobiota bacterium]
MNLQSPASKPRSTDNPGISNGRSRLLVSAYCLAIFFVVLFVLLLSRGSKVAPPLGEPAWALVVAIALTVPALIPWLVRNVVPRIHSIKISEVEIALHQDNGPTKGVSLALQAMATSLQDNPVLSEYAGRMTSLSSSIIDAIRTVQGEGHQVLPIDLLTPWVVPNLYFLALMAAQKTRVQQIVFVDSRFSPDRFICFSSPAEIITALEWQRPYLKEAALAARFDEYPRSAELAAGAEFFQQLSTIYSRTPQQSNVERITPFTPETLLFALGTAAHQESLQWIEPVGEKEYRAVLSYDSRFVAALNSSQLLFLVSRERVATAVARAVLRTD